MPNVVNITVVAHDKASGEINALSKGVGMAVGVATAGIIGLGAAALATGVKTAASLEQAQISYNTLLGSTDKAKAHLADLQKFAAATPFELPGLIQADRLLIGAGESADKTLKSLTAWGDASGALGQTQDQFSRTMLAVSQAMGAGKLQAGDLLQITEAGIPVWKLLSEALGKPEAEVRKLSQAGKLLTADVLPKLEKQMEKDYGGSMAKQSQTLNGLWSTFMDTMNMGLANALQPLIPILKDALPGAANALGVALRVLSSVIVGIIKGVQLMSQWMEQHKAVAITVAAVIGGILVAAFVAWAASAAAAAAATIAATWPILAIGAAIGLLVAGVIYAYKHWDWFKTAVDATVRFLRDVAWPVIKEVAVKIGQWVRIGIEAAVNAFKWLMGVVGDVIGWIQDHWTLVRFILLGPIGSAILWVVQHFGQIVTVVQGVVNDVRNAVSGVYHAIVDPFASAFNWVSSHRPNLGGLTSMLGFEHGGIVGAAATGGARGNLVQVGEHGRELVRLPFGSRVMSNPDTERMLSGGGGGSAGGGHVVIEWKGDAAALEFLRRMVRVYGGGNAQTALGRSL